MRPFSLLVKPASWNCNLRCKSCFYLEKSGLYNHPRPRMTEEVLRVMTEKFMAVDMPVHCFGWQGGEPTLMGLDFFRRAVRCQGRFLRAGKRVSNVLQTNGVLLDDKWCGFLAEHDFLVGISIDGPPGLHDAARIDAEGRGSHARVMRGLEALKRNRAEFNVLTLVGRASQERPLEIYNYLRDLGIRHHQYVECVEFESGGELSPVSVEPEKWGEFLCAIFDEWHRRDTREVSVRLFDSILTKLVDNQANACALGERCGEYFVVEHNGDVYPCDFYVRPELRLGNIMLDDWGRMAESELFLSFGGRKLRLDEKCKACPFLSLCAGCCPKNRPARGADPARRSVLCPGWEMFYRHALPRLQLLARSIICERERLLARGF